MKVLVFGPSGSGKTFIAQALQKINVHAFDADEIEGLSAWYSKDGKKVEAPLSASEALKNQYSFLWSKAFLKDFINRFDEVFIFGGSGNITQVFDLFDKAYCLKIDPQLQLERLKSKDRSKPAMDADENGPVTWGNWFEELANKNNIPFLDASATPEAVLDKIRQ